MSTFVLVHGAWHGGWCWERVTPLLTAAGHAVAAPDMPAMGDDTTPIAEATFAHAVERLVAAVDAAAGPVLVVGHSWGGIPITQAAEERPDAIAKLVYLTAFLPSSGESCPSLAMSDHGTVGYGFAMAPDSASCTVRDEWVKASFYGDCSDDDVTWAKTRLRPHPMEHYCHVATITAERAGRVSRAYIECLRDHAITPGFQRKMYTEHPCDTVLSLDASHSPFISMPQALADHLLSLAA